MKEDNICKYPKVPATVSLGLTNKCNLNCKHCSMNPCRHGYDEDLSTKEWMDFIDHLVEIKVLKVHISGGEPFVRKDIYDILDHISKKPLWIDGINTNATLIDKDGAKRLMGYKKRGPISVSVDGSCAEIHDKIRGAGAFNKMIAGIRNMIDQGNNVVTFTTVTKHNKHDVEKILKLGKELGIGMMKFNPVMMLGNAKDNEEEISLSKTDFKELMHQVPYWNEKYKDYFTGLLLDMYDMEKRRREQIENISEGQSVNTFMGCKAGVQKSVLRGDGWVVPCDRLWDMKAGNIRDRDFLDIWNNSEVFKEFRKKFFTPIDIIPECKGCEFNKICTGGCPATMYDITGDIWGLDYISCYKFISDCLS